MTFRPVAGQIHVRPDPPPTQSDGGIVIPDAYQDMPPMSGAVIAVGPPAVDAQATISRIHVTAMRQAIAACDEVAEQFREPTCLQILREELCRMLRTAPQPERSVQVGDRVVFPYTAGCDVVIGEDSDGRTIILKESDVIAIVERTEVAA